jgi:hypothetical protein
VVTLSTAKRSIVEKCVESLSEASSWVAVPGIVVGDGPAIANGSPDTSGDTCESRNRLRICIESGVAGLEEPWIQTNLLTALAFVPNQQRPDQVEVGLNGSGETPLMIFDSMRATSS